MIEFLKEIAANSTPIAEDLSKGFQGSMPDSLVELMQKGDSSCKYQIGDRVVKVGQAFGDIYPENSQGIVIGNLKIDDNFIEDLYIVKMKVEEDESMYVTTNEKLKLL